MKDFIGKHQTLIILGILVIAIILTAIYKDKVSYQDPRYRSGQWTEKLDFN